MGSWESKSEFFGGLDFIFQLVTTNQVRKKERTVSDYFPLLHLLKNKQCRDLMGLHVKTETSEAQAIYDHSSFLQGKKNFREK